MFQDKYYCTLCSIKSVNNKHKKEWTNHSEPIKIMQIYFYYILKINYNHLLCKGTKSINTAIPNRDEIPISLYSNQVPINTVIGAIKIKCAHTNP